MPLISQISKISIVFFSPRWTSESLEIDSVTPPRFESLLCCALYVLRCLPNHVHLPYISKISFEPDIYKKPGIFLIFSPGIHDYIRQCKPIQSMCCVSLLYSYYFLLVVGQRNVKLIKANARTMSFLFPSPSTHVHGLEDSYHLSVKSFVELQQQLIGNELNVFLLRTRI